jgi:UDP-glucose 4-epimerase
MDETHPLNPTTPYAASKAACDHMVQSYISTFGIKACIARPFNNYGPRQNDKAYAGVIPLFVNAFLDDTKPTIYGDGFQTRDYVYVTDTAEAIRLMMEKATFTGDVYNIASGIEVSVDDIYGRLENIFGKTVVPEYRMKRPGDVLRHCADASKAEAVLGWTPTVHYDEGLARTVKWYKVKKDRQGGIYVNDSRWDQ